MDKVPVICKCKDKRSWCPTRRCACFKTEVKCGVASHGGDRNSETDCPSIASPELRSQKVLRIRGRQQKAALEEGRQRKATLDRNREAAYQGLKNRLQTK